MESANLILSALPTEDLEAIQPLLQKVDLQQRKQLTFPGEEPQFGYFVTSGIVSLVATTQAGESVEVSVIGREGVVGAGHLLNSIMTTTSQVQLSGTALRIPMRDLRRLFAERAGVRKPILHYVNGQINILSQLVLCQRLHGLEQRLSRWLLMVKDRIDDEYLTLTQEFVAVMLGAQRTTVTAVAGDLQRSGLIEYSRGKLHIRDRAGLEKAACECYGVIRPIYPELVQSQPPLPVS